MMVSKHEQLQMWMDGAAVAVDLQIEDNDRERIIAQLELNLGLIEPLLAFDLPSDSTS